MTGLVTLLPAAIVYAALFLLPHMSRSTHFFAVTVAPDFARTPPARAILRRYRAMVLLHSLISLALLFAAGRIGQPALFVAGVTWPVLGSLAAVASAHRAALPFSSEAAVEARPAEGAGEPPADGGFTLWAGPFAIFAAAAIWLWLNWERIPARFPVHWGASGAPDRWAGRNFGGVFAPLIVGAGACAAFVLVHYLVLRRARGSAAARRATGWVLVSAGFFLAVLFSWIAVRPAVAGPELAAGEVAALLLLPFLFGAAAIYALARQWRRLGPDTSPDRLWKWGLFYYNPGDPALFVEKRLGYGYTFNFANRWSWVLLAGLLLPMLVLPLLLK